jgi:hypothetical protein
MQDARSRFFAVVLPSGKVLLGGGGLIQNSAELFDPSTNSFNPTGYLTASRGQSPFAVPLSSEHVDGNLECVRAASGSVTLILKEAVTVEIALPLKLSLRDTTNG